MYKSRRKPRDAFGAIPLDEGMAHFCRFCHKPFSPAYNRDPHEILRQDVEESLSLTYDKSVNTFLEERVFETIAEAIAFNALLPAYRRKLRGLHLNYLHWFERLKHDPMHKDVMKTRRRFMEEVSMDVEESTDAAVERRKSLLIFEPRPIPTQEEEQVDESD